MLCRIHTGNTVVLLNILAVPNQPEVDFQNMYDIDKSIFVFKLHLEHKQLFNTVNSISRSSS